MSTKLIGPSGQKRIRCYCSKRAIVQMGIASFPYITVPVLLGVACTVIYILFAPGSILEKLPLLAIFSVLTLPILAWEFFDNKKVMSMAQHTARCSTNVALKSLLYIGPWGSFGIVEGSINKEDGSK